MPQPCHFGGRSRQPSDQEQKGLGCLYKFRQWAEQGKWYQFDQFHNHYDWWMFPISNTTPNLQKFDYTVYSEDIKLLKADKEYIKNYREGVILVLTSWGWDVKAQTQLKHPDLKNGQKWKGYTIRLQKLIRSLELFGQDDLLKSALKFEKDTLSISEKAEMFFRTFVQGNGF